MISLFFATAAKSGLLCSSARKISLTSRGGALIFSVLIDSSGAVFSAVWALTDK